MSEVRRGTREADFCTFRSNNAGAKPATTPAACLVPPKGSELTSARLRLEQTEGAGRQPLRQGECHRRRIWEPLRSAADGCTTRRGVGWVAGEKRMQNRTPRGAPVWHKILLILAALVSSCGRAEAGGYRFSVQEDEVLLNGQPFKIIGLRCSNALLTDAATQELVDQLPQYRSSGINTVSVFFMGSRFGDVKGYRPDATLDPRYAARMGRIVQAADRLGMVVIVGCLYWSDSRAKDELVGVWRQEDANRAVANTVRWQAQMFARTGR